MVACTFVQRLQAFAHTPLHLSECKHSFLYRIHHEYLHYDICRGVSDIAQTSSEIFNTATKGILYSSCEKLDRNKNMDR